MYDDVYMIMTNFVEIFIEHQEDIAMEVFPLVESHSLVAI